MRFLGTAIFVFVLFEARDENREPHFFVFLLVFCSIFCAFGFAEGTFARKNSN